ncbi:MAG: hypothetical protein ABSE49_21385 [Polyangiaceae bacterium]
MGVWRITRAPVESGAAGPAMVTLLLMLAGGSDVRLRRVRGARRHARARARVDLVGCPRRSVEWV